MLDTIIFDLGGVLIDWNPRHFYRDYFKDDAKMEWFLGNICTGEWNTEQDRGRTLAEGTAILLQNFPEYAADIEAYYQGWGKMLKGEIPETVAILKKLKESAIPKKLLGLTNWSAETFPCALERFSFLQLLEGIVVSGEEKLIKPDKKIFQALLDRYHLQAENCVYIDDTAYNVAAANELGFHAIHFTSGAALERELMSLNLLP